MWFNSISILSYECRKKATFPLPPFLDREAHSQSSASSTSPIFHLKELVVNFNFINFAFANILAQGFHHQLWCQQLRLSQHFNPWGSMLTFVPSTTPSSTFQLERLTINISIINYDFTNILDLVARRQPTASWNLLRHQFGSRGSPASSTTTFASASST